MGEKNNLGVVHLVGSLELLIFAKAVQEKQR
jgi:hypothetical protein